MDSPETTLPAPSAPNAAGVSPPAVQESPFLTYVNTFSPIKEPSSLRAPSMIRELNFPSPSPVFTSPHLNPVHKDKLLKRCSDSRKFSLDYACDIREQLEKASHYGGKISQSIFFPCSTNTVRGQNAQIQSSSSPSDCVDDFLADPAEDSCNMSALSNLCLSQALTDVSGRCEGSTSLPIVSHLEEDRQTNNSFDDLTTIPAISDMGAEPMKTEELKIVESLLLPSHNGENLDVGVPLGQICEQGVDLMDADDNVRKSDEVKVSERVEGGSQIGENDGSVIPFDSSGHNNVDLIERDSNLEMQPKFLGVHPEDVSLVSKSQWGGCQLAYAMRRRLEFVPSSAPTMNLGSSKNPSNLRSDITVDQRIPEAKSPTSSSDLEMQNASHGQPIRASENTIAYSSPSGSFFKNDQDSSMQEMFKPLNFAEDSLNRSDSSVPRPAGIGLHLNSIGKALSNNGKLSTQSVDIEQGNNSDSPIVPQQLGVIGSDRNVNASGHLDGNSQTALICCSIDKTEDDDITVPKSQSSLLPAYVDQFMTPGELIEISPKKKGKKSPGNDGCKHCNCKKSKCLKLYCDCFAAGVYCTDTCSCQGCLNRLEHKDIVMETRQQIENRNPLAFAPKVIVHDTLVASRPSGDADKHTPASARHKRGCNCKRSQCLKKYCECFQSKVGCSLGCRCEGCKNTYGRKEGSANSENELIKKTWNEKHGRGYYVIADEEDADVDLPKNSMPLCLSPLTPLVDGSNAIIQSKSQFLFLKYQSSPESSVSRDKNNTHEVADTEAADIISPKWDRLGDAIVISGGAKVNAPPVQRTSPMTPTPRFGQTRFALESSSDCRPVNIDEDDSTPDILLRNDSQPGNGPRVGSPNKKKRVSPPHHHHQQLEEGSSRSMKSRKFILKSVPSFPCLTPYSKDCKTQPP